MSTYYKRELESLLKKALKQFPVILITGARQTGKSTLLQHLLKKYTYVTLDDPIIREKAKKDPKKFLSQFKEVVIDEIQYAPELLSYIKMNVDKKRQKMGQYILTGSQIFQVMQGVSETLAGRIAIFHLYPFSFLEIPNGKKTDLFLQNQMIKGFYPQFFIQKDLVPSLWQGSYLSTYLERDIRNLKSIADLSLFQKFIQMLSYRCGRLLNISELSKKIGISQPTIKSWLSILESTYVIYLLKPFYKNMTSRVIKSPKIYFIDTGILCHLLGISNKAELAKSEDKGFIFENMCISEALKRTSFSLNKKQLYFYRNANQDEVDLVIDEGGKLKCFEIKYTKKVNKNMTKSLSHFISKTKATGTIISMQSKKNPF